MNAPISDKIIWLDGQYLPWQEASVHTLTHSLHYGFGIFDSVRAYKTANGPALFRCHDHTERLFRSAQIMNMQIPFSKTQIDEVCHTIISKNNLPSAYIRPICFYGGGYLGMDLKKLTTHVMIAAWEWKHLHGEDNAQQGLKVKTSSFRRLSVNSSLLKAKATGNYINSILAFQEALANGADEALFLDQDGFVCEGSGENIFIVSQGKLYTPDLAYALAGITRDTIFTLAHDLGLTVQEKRLTRDDIYTADEAFFTGTAAEIVAIREIDGRVIGNGKPGSITGRLHDLFKQTVAGENQHRLPWLSWT